MSSDSFRQEGGEKFNVMEASEPRRMNAAPSYEKLASSEGKDLT
jgi:hypothetical protein